MSPEAERWYRAGNGDRTREPQAAGPALPIERELGQCKRVDARAVEPGSPVEMRTRGPPGMADRATHVPAPHARAVADCRRVQVKVHGEQAKAATENDTDAAEEPIV